EIMGNLQKYPNMAHDVDALYTLSVPKNVREAIVYKKFSQKLGEKRNLAQGVSGEGRPGAEEADDRPPPGDFKAAWEYAKRKHGFKFNT
ncbi:MAG: hypothetical protein ACWGQW_25035, partial [bacterium]